jgi:hypothetical protein
VSLDVCSLVVAFFPFVLSALWYVRDIGADCEQLTMKINLSSLEMLPDWVGQLNFMLIRGMNEKHMSRKTIIFF